MRYFIASLFALCAMGTAWSGVQEIGYGQTMGREHTIFGAALVLIALVSLVFISLIEDVLAAPPPFPTRGGRR